MLYLLRGNVCNMFININIQINNRYIDKTVYMNHGFEYWYRSPIYVSTSSRKSRVYLNNKLSLKFIFITGEVCNIGLLILIFKLTTDI